MFYNVVCELLLVDDIQLGLVEICQIVVYGVYLLELSVDELDGNDLLLVLYMWCIDLYGCILMQCVYLCGIFLYDLLFGIGLVGMGKMYLVVVCVVDVLECDVIKCIVLMCLVVEVGECLGFLLGDFV